jgi:exonuclease-1
MIYLFIDFFKFKNIKFIVAPFEADSQLAYMYHSKQIDYIMSEDSDLVAYGCNDIIRQFHMSEEVKYFSFKNISDKSTEIEKCFVRLSDIMRRE